MPCTAGTGGTYSTCKMESVFLQQTPVEEIRPVFLYALFVILGMSGLLQICKANYYLKNLL